MDNENNDKEYPPPPNTPPESENDIWANDSLLGEGSPTRGPEELLPEPGLHADGLQGDPFAFVDQLIDDSNFEPVTVFDNTPHDGKKPKPRELFITPESVGYVPEIGDVLNERFEILKLIAAGTLGLVYLVQDMRLKDKKALKLMHPALMKDQQAADRFIDEIKALQQLSHENIVRIYDFGKTERGDLSFFTMEYIHGTTLADLLKKKGGRLPLDKSLALIYQILDTLTYVHQRGTHRNLKPVNIMVRPTGKVVLLNVGLTAELGTGNTTRRESLGSAHFQAPEQRIDATHATPRVDIHAVGVLLYLLLTGKVPLGNAPPPSRVNRELPRRLNPVIMRCMALDPEARYQSAADVSAALHRTQRSRVEFFLIISVIILLGVGLTLWWYQG